MPVYLRGLGPVLEQRPAELLPLAHSGARSRTEAGGDHGPGGGGRVGVGGGGGRGGGDAAGHRGGGAREAGEPGGGGRRRGHSNGDCAPHGVGIGMVGRWRLRGRDLLLGLVGVDRAGKSLENEERRRRRRRRGGGKLEMDWNFKLKRNSTKF